MIDALFGMGGELQTSGIGIALHQRVETGFVNRHLAAPEHGNLVLVDIDA